MSVKRYAAHTNIDDFKSDWHESKDGPMVKHEDYAALEARCAALAAELQSVKAMNDCLSEELRGYESDGAFEGPKMHLLWWQCETPNLDAFLAEVRAQGVEMFAAVLRRKGDDAFFDAIAEAQANAADQFAAQLLKGAAS